MKKHITALFLIFGLLSHFTVQGQNQNPTYSKDWQKVYSLEVQDLPKSALKVVEQIERQGRKDQNGSQLIKVLLYQSKFALLLEEEAQLKVVQKLESEIAIAQSPEKQILQSILADLYWQYYKRNRWKIQRRTATDEIVNSDFRTWDLRRLTEKVHELYQGSLTDPAALQSKTEGDYAPIIEREYDSKKYRPTLYDFIAHRALDFYSNEESSLARPADQFEVEDPLAFSTNPEFVQWNIPQDGPLAFAREALLILQNLTRFHLDRKDHSALADVNLQRLEFVKRKMNGEEVEKQFEKALEATIPSYQGDLQALFYMRLAQLYSDQGKRWSPDDGEKYRWKLKKAVHLAQKIQKEYLASPEKALALQLERSLTNQELNLRTEEYIPLNTPSRVRIEFRNLEQVHFKALKISREQQKKLQKIYKDSTRRAFLKELPIAKSWTAKWGNQDDYQKHSSEVLLPPLPNGLYILLATLDEDTDLSGAYSTTWFQTTNIALLQSKYPKYTLFQVVNRNNGQPIPGAKVRFTSTQRRKKLNKRFTTNAQGTFKYAIPDYYYNVETFIETAEESTYLGNGQLREDDNYNRKTSSEIRAKAFVFTDRGIYRPGQTLYFKSLVLKYRTNEKEQPKPLTNEWVEVVLEDPNGQEVGSLDLQLNDFGSVAGEFKIPLGGLTGEYIISVDEGYEDSSFYDQIYFEGFDYADHYISVEEYKRPRFETLFEPVTGTYKVNDSVLAKAKATSFAGSAISDAKVSYRVVRKPQYPYWYRWYYPDLDQSSVEIIQGETTTNNKGQYEITFVAEAYEQAYPEALPVFHYTLYADVTDLNGETRSAETTINVGYHSLLANLRLGKQIDRRNKKVKMEIRTENLNGQEVPSSGTVTIYKLQAPSAVLRSRPWDVPEIPGWEEKEFRSLFPHDAYTEGEADLINWPKGEVVLKTSFNTATEKKYALGNMRQWPLGRYLAVLETKDPEGVLVKDELRFALNDSKSKEVADRKAMVFRIEQRAYTPGEEVVLQVGTALSGQHLIVEAERKNGVITRYALRLDNEIKELRFPITNTDLGGMALRYHSVGMNEFHSGSIQVVVLEPVEKLKIETLTFRDKLAPGTPETWSFRITNDEKGAEAELLASMYDASLDQFRTNNWSVYTRFPQNFYPKGYTSTFSSFGTNSSRAYGLQTTYFRMPKRSYSQLNWFGLSMTNTSWSQRSYINDLRRIIPRSPSQDERKDFDKVVSGQVLDSEGVPLPGATVVIEGTTYGTQTDFDGYYSIKVKKGERLRFSYLGYQISSESTTGKTTLDIQLEENASALDEVVVTGYGSKRKKQALGSTVTVSSEEMLSAPNADVSQVLSGQVAGLAVVEDAKLNEVLVELTDSDSTGAPLAEKPDLSGIKARTNLQETAFFFPQLRTDKKGNVSFDFTTPEALTRWKLQLLAHDKSAVTGQQTLSTVTQKELMVLPNPPRFLREGDTLVFSTKIASLLESEMNGFAQLELSNPFTGESLDAELSNTQGTQEFTIGAKGNTSLNWTLIIPKAVEAVQYRIVAKAGNFSDGEQNVLPVLTNRMLVTESLPLWVRSGQEKTFQLEKLATTTSTTRSNHQMTLEITSNPVWYAVQALPYLMEYPYECAEQTFSRYYANSLGAYIANSNPKIKAVFAEWKDTDALESALEKNQELKSLIIQETPWLRDAQSESEQKKRIGLLFDLVRLEEQQESTLKKLQEMQMSDGGFPWFKGSREPNRYITQHIVSGFGHLQKLAGQKQEAWEEMMEDALRYLDYEIHDDYQDLLKTAKKLRDQAKTKQKGLEAERAYMAKRHVYQTQLYYLYLRSFYPEFEIPKNTQVAIDYYLNQAKKFHLDFSLYSKGLNSMIQQRNGDTTLAQSIWKSLLENSTENEELGLYWKNNTAGWYWYQAPVETHALLIEAANEVLKDGPEKTQTLDAMKTWLLKNKQTSRWQTTKATTEAIYALLMNGSDWLSEDTPLQVVWGGKSVSPPANDVQAGTGYYKIRKDKEEVNPELATVTLKQTGKGIAWGGLYWQYFEDLDKITTAETPLQLTKQLFRKENTSEGEKLFALEEGSRLTLGDVVRVRIELKTDRDMEFVHMKDMRASGLEPIDVLSEYKWQDGLGYYQSTRDAATNFFFDYLRKGVYVFEYDLRVNNAGEFSNGITSIQCMYAPEFTSHSEGIRIKVTNE